jgi:hypothetical protein
MSLTAYTEELRGTLFRFGVVLVLLIFFAWQV